MSPSGIGDMFMLTPALRALSEGYPGAEIDLLALHEYVGEAFRLHPRIRRIIYLGPYAAGRPERRFATVSSGGSAVKRALRYYPELVLRIVTGRYNLGLNFSLSPEYDHLGNAILFASGIPLRLGMRDHGAGLLSFSAEPDFQTVHLVDAYLAVLAPLDLPSLDTGYEFSVPHDNRLRARALLAAGHLAGRSGPLVALHPGGKILVNSRRWPVRYYTEVARTLVRERGAAIVVLGDESERELCESIASQAGGASLNAAGRLTVPEVVALLSECDLCITNDTSTLHLAEAARTPQVISIFRPTAHALLAPRSERHAVVYSRLPCSPCLGSIITKDSPRCWRDIKEECLEGILPQQVLNKTAVDARPRPRMPRSRSREARDRASW